MKTAYELAIEQSAGAMRVDANETAAFARQLESIAVETYDVIYASAKARSLFSLVRGVDPAAESYTYRSFDKFGEWKGINDYADDFPSVEIEGRESNQKIKGFGGSYGYSVMDLRQSRLMNKSLDQARAEVVRERFEALIDKLACVGDTTLGITGLANASGITDLTSTVTNDWTAAGTSVTNILADLDLMRKQLFNDSLGEWNGQYVLALPTTVYAAIKTKRLSAADGFGVPLSVMQFMLDSSPDISKIVHWPRLDTAGASGTPRALMWVDSPNIAQLLLPQDFEQMPPQARNMKYVVNCHGRCGGVCVRYPKGVVFTDGIDN